MPDVELPLLELPDPSPGILSAGWSANIQGGIANTSSTQFPIQAGIKQGYNFPIQVGITAASIAAPTNALAKHLGQGVVFATWQHSTPAKVDYYEVWASTNFGGPYTPYQHNRFRKPRAFLANVPVGITAYFQVRAVGYNGALSSFAQVKQGKLERPTISLKVRAITGSTIAAGEIFTCPDQETGRLIAVRPSVDITL